LGAEAFTNGAVDVARESGAQRAPKNRREGRLAEL
jgi:hypothetical protein